MQNLKAVPIYEAKTLFSLLCISPTLYQHYNLVMCFSDRTAHAFMMYDVWLEQVVVRSKTTFSNADRMHPLFVVTREKMSLWIGSGMVATI